MPQQRLYFLDWLRILAFFLLVLYHTGMYYVTWDFHVKSPHASAALEPFMMMSSPWRMSLLFLISGVAAGFLARKLATARLVRERSGRLLVPLLFGKLVVVPPQSYFQVVEAVGYTGDYFDFMKLYVQAYHGFCKGNDCLSLPTWNHLWFVAYIWVYTLDLALLIALVGHERLARAGAWLGRVLTGWRALVLPIAFLAVVRVTLKSHFPETHNLTWDWFNHATYLPVFLAGVLLSNQEGFWRELERLRFVALGIALACWAVLVSYHSQPEAMQTWLATARTVWATCQWCAIVAVCGFGRRHLNFDSAKRRYLTEAVFPVYILHQTLIICFSRPLLHAELPPVTEGIVLVVLTFTVSFGIFEVVRRVPVLRPLFGLGRYGGPAVAGPLGTVPGSLGTVPGAAFQSAHRNSASIPGAAASQYRGGVTATPAQQNSTTTPGTAGSPYRPCGDSRTAVPPQPN